jgi:RNA recognition motif-containing protein
LFKLDFKVDNEKLLEVFIMAGTVVSAKVILHRNAKSRGFGFVEFSHPLEAVQAICILFC